LPGKIDSRKVIAFGKNHCCADLMAESPSPKVDKVQLDQLGIALKGT